MTSNIEPPNRGSTKSAGQMTAVMRAAVPPRAKRVLRVALVRGGKVMEERILPRDAALTVGPSERNTFVIAELPSSLRLIEHTPEGYRLQVAGGVSGRVAKGAAVHDLATVGGDGTLALGDDSRGKLVVGDSIVLFHFVEPPVPPPRAQLPLAVQKGLLGELDWKTTCIAAFSFLFHFGAIGAVYSDWANPVIDDDGYLARTVLTIKDLPPAPPLEHPTPEPVADASAKPTDAAPAPARANAGHSTAPGPVAHGGPSRMSETRAHDLQRELASLNDAMLQVIGAQNNGAVGRVLAAGNDAPLGMLDKIAAGPGGARPGDGTGLNLRGDGGAVRPGVGGRGGLLGGDGHADGHANDVGKVAEVKKPVGKASVEPPSVSGNVPDAGRVVAGMRGALRACYKHALDEDPNMRGSVRVTVSVAPNGEVKSAQAANNGLSSSMIACVTRVVRGAQFSAPEGGGATLVIPMSFLPQ
ncbi:MAG: AgmX/PglI C-terminal domain-containing protein [Minicystis sp.]